MENKTLTDQIYQELVEGLKTGLDYTHLQAKYGTSKGPFYNAFGRFIRDMEPKVRELGAVQAKLDSVGLTLDSLDQRVKEAESSLAPLEEKKNTLNQQIETFETKLAEKSEGIKQVGELEKRGFDAERLRQLREALTEIGAKSGLKGKEAVSKFFDELKDYDAKTGFEGEIQRLGTITETKKLEAENWRAKAERLESQYRDLKEAIDETEKEQSRLKAQLERLKKLFAWGDLNEKQYLAEKENTLVALRALTPPETKSRVLEGLAEFLKSVTKAWKEANQEQRNKLARQLLDEIWVKDKQVIAVKPRLELKPFFQLSYEEWLKKFESENSTPSGSDVQYAL